MADEEKKDIEKQEAEAVVEQKPAEPKAEEKKEALQAAVVSDDPLADEAPAPVKVRKVKGSKNVPLGIAFITATFNNTLVSITDRTGAVISWSSGGKCGFKGSRKSTAYAATLVAQDAARQAVIHGMQEIEVRVQGPGAGRESAIRALQSAGLNITAIRDITPIPHNGCRPPKRRRV